VTSQNSIPRRDANRTLRLSIVIPVYRSETTIALLTRLLVAEFASACDLEIVLVNDGSPDNSAEVCRSLANEIPQVCFVNLSRNFGEHNAVMAGLNRATGDCAVIMDDDFQNPPSEVWKLVDEIQNGRDVVFSRYERKRHSVLRNLGSRFNNFIASQLLEKPSELYLSSFKAISRFVIDEIIKYDGPYPYIDGLILRTTRNFACVLVRHEPRAEGQSGYTLRKLVALWLNMSTSFSVIPLRLASAAGFLCSILGLLFAAGFAIEKLMHPELPGGWASLIVSLFVIGGIQLFALGLMGEYLGRLFLKESGQPQFIIREEISANDQAKDSRDAA